MILDVLKVDGTVAVFPVERVSISDAGWGLVNATWYPIWLRFGGSDPPVPPAIGNREQWGVALGAGDTWADTYPAGFDGNIWVGVFNPSGNTLAPGLAQYATLESFEKTIPEVASAAPTTLLPQERVVTVPVVPHIPILWKAQDISSAFSNATIIAPTSAGVTYTAYLYGASLEIRGVRFWRGSFFVAYHSGMPAFLSDGPELCTAELYAGVPWTFPIGIIAVSATTPASTASIRLRAEPAEQYPASVPALLTATFLLDIDLTGQAPPPAIGNGASTAPGVVY